MVDSGRIGTSELVERILGLLQEGNPSLSKLGRKVNLKEEEVKEVISVMRKMGLVEGRAPTTFALRIMELPRPQS